MLDAWDTGTTIGWYFHQPAKHRLQTTRITATNAYSTGFLPVVALIKVNMVHPRLSKAAL